MSKLWIHQFKTLSQRPSGAQLAPLDGVIGEEAVDFSSVTPSQPLSDQTYFVRLKADADCHVAAGTNPTATTDSLPLTAGQAEYFSVQPGAIISVIEAD